MMAIDILVSSLVDPIDILALIRQTMESSKIHNHFDLWTKNCALDK